MEFVLDLLKLTIPALVVFITVRMVLREYLNKQYQLNDLAFRKNKHEQALPLRLQAYERLSLFCERIAVPTLLFRVRQENMSAAELRLAMLFAIQQEYEHNITQQVYVSQQLWEIIKYARDDSVSTLSLAMESVKPEATAKELGQALLSIVERRGETAVDKALQAIKKEAGVLLSS